MKLLQFFGRQPPPAPREKHYGLYSLSAGDIIISKPLFDLIILRLRDGTPTDREHLAAQLHDLTTSMY